MAAATTTGEQHHDDEGCWYGHAHQEDQPCLTTIVKADTPTYDVEQLWAAAAALGLKPEYTYSSR